MQIYLLTAKHTYYDMDIAPTFWQNLESRIKNYSAIIIDMVYKEILKGDDELADSWLLAHAYNSDNVLVTNEKILL